LPHVTDLSEDQQRDLIATASDGLTMNQAISGERIWSLKQKSKAQIIFTVAAITSHCLAQFNVTNGMSATQVAQFAEDFCDKFTTFSLEDLVLMFKKARMAEYGETFNRIDSQIIFTWLSKYDQQRCDAIEAVHKQYEKTGEHYEDKQPKELKKALSRPAPTYEAELDKVSMYLKHYTTNFLELIFDVWNRANQLSNRRPGEAAPYDEMCAVINSELELRNEIESE